jgi:predicted O-linked N-acetylglucosamine transferase (SPINDLY family)
VNDFDSAKSLFMEALGHIQSREYEPAERKLRASLELVPQRISTLTNLSTVLIRLRKYPEAEKTLASAVAVDETSAQAWLNYGLLEQEKNSNYPKAIEYFDKALALNPGYPEAWLNRGAALIELRRHEEAIDSYHRAIAAKADYADAYSNLGNAYVDLKQYQVALENYDKAYALNPDLDHLIGSRLHARMLVCDWRGLPQQVSEMTQKIGCGLNCTAPFPVLALVDSPALQARAAQTWANEDCPAGLALPGLATRPKTGKVRIGYFSADFRNHPVAVQAAGLFEAHDRSRFELTAFYFGGMRDEMTGRIEAAFDQFIDVHARSDEDVAMLARHLGIDIAVDLGGHTQDSRAKIFAMRAAPLQVGYLGYPGTLGARYMDYLVADGIVIPEASRHYYCEKIACLPNSYLVNDRTRAIAERTFARAELGLPATGFVFCCFNGSYKINPATFDGWMRILGQVPGSVLWLSEANPAAVLGLRKEAQTRGIDAARLIFAGRMPLAEEHLARMRAADLFVDTLPYNAHSTASDALWAGVPVLTCMGEAFAGRVAASLLNAIGLEELVTATQEQYEALAVELATRPERLGQIRKKLEKNRLAKPLFDTELFARHLEDAYMQMYERHHASLPPDHVRVKA